MAAKYMPCVSITHILAKKNHSFLPTKITFFYTVIINMLSWKQELKLPGFEVIDEKEKKAISSIFDEGKVFFAHGFDEKR